MTARAEAISCSDTRPSALAMWPMTRNVVGKNSALTCAGSDRAAEQRAQTVTAAGVELVADQRSQHRPPGSEGREAEYPTDDFASPIHE